jgi:hypothetical protein
VPVCAGGGPSLTTPPLFAGLRQGCRGALSASGATVGRREWEVDVTPEERFDRLVDEFTPVAEVSVPGSGRGFGSTSLRHHDKIFAMLAAGRLVVKLPKARVDTLVGAGQGVRFDANKGVPMKEWFSLDPSSDLSWLSVANEALDFARRR